MHPILWQLGSFKLHSYGLMVALATLAGVFVAARIAHRRGLRQELCVDTVIWSLILGIIGARVLYIILNWNVYAADPLSMLRVYNGGLSYLGGLVFGTATILVFAYRAGVHPVALIDAMTPSAAIGYAIGRIGCFLNGCCYGSPCSLPWGVRFPGQSEPHHPSQLYSSLSGLLLFVLLWRLGRRVTRRGVMAAVWFGGYGIYRFLVEFTRAGSTAELGLWGLTQAQWASLVLTGSAAVWLISIYRRQPDGR